MPVTQILDVAIGLFLLYLVLSLTCSSVTEFVAAMVGLRAKVLAHRLKLMLGDAGRTSLLEHGAILAMGRRPSYIPSSSFSAAVLDKVFEAAGGAAATAVSLRQALAAKAAAEAPGGARPMQALLSVFDRTQGSIKEFVASVETWFDTAMERATGTYKRWSQVIVLGIGLVVTIALNADTLTMTRRLWNDAPLRQALNAAATKVTAQPQDTVMAKASEALGELREMADSLNVKLPLGWADRSLRPGRGAGGLLAKFLGWLITAAAVSLGAPFWFDLLKRLVSLRGAGAVPATAEEQRKAEGKATG